MENIVFKIGIAILGIVFYTVYKSLKYVKIFDWKIFFQENYRKWIWAFVVIVLIAVITFLLPETAEAIKTFTGIDISTEPASFFTLGIGLSELVRRATKTVGNRPNDRTVGHRPDDRLPDCPDDCVCTTNCIRNK